MRPRRDADARAIPLLSLRAFVAYERVKPTYISELRSDILEHIPVAYIIIQCMIGP